MCVSTNYVRIIFPSYRHACIKYCMYYFIISRFYKKKNWNIYRICKLSYTVTKAGAKHVKKIVFVES